MAAYEVNFDGLVGPTHNYAGLSHGNVASRRHGGDASNPRAAALQGLAKMLLLARRGLKQAVLPPHPRPSFEMLRALGFAGDDSAVLAAAARHPRLLGAAWSASSMWVANAATVAPSSDTADGRVHLVPANLASNLHRAFEPAHTTQLLRKVFRDRRRFVVHDALPGGLAMADEGAANHTRLAPRHGDRGIHLFVYGRDETSAGPKRFPARQTLAAAQAVARLLQLDPAAVIFARQNPTAIDAGVFHNDVIAAGNENVLLHHEAAWVDVPGVVQALQRAFTRLHSGVRLHVIQVPARRVSVREAVTTYLFNSQLITVAPGRMLLLAPTECRRSPSVRAWLDALLASEATPIREVCYVDLRQSMRNGGGPACLRLRVVLTDAELAALPRPILLNDARHARLAAYIRARYPARLTQRSLGDAALAHRALQITRDLTRRCLGSAGTT